MDELHVWNFTPHTKHTLREKSLRTKNSVKMMKLSPTIYSLPEMKELFTPRVDQKSNQKVLDKPLSMVNFGLMRKAANVSLFAVCLN